MLLGREGVAARVDELSSLVDEQGLRALRRMPIVELVGPPHVGKSALLRGLAELHGGVVPVAWLDFAYVSAEESPFQLLKLLPFVLSRPHETFGRVEFPRTIGALIAAARDDLPETRAQAVREIQRSLEDPASIERITRYVVAFAQEATKLVQNLTRLPQPVPGSTVIETVAPDLVLGALRRTKVGRKRISPLVAQGLGPWPGMTSSTLPETLVDINHDLRSADPAVRGRAEAQPWAAFLEDLRAAYTGREGRGRNRCCVLALDNLDGPSGRRFVRALADARRLRAAADSGADPLLVIGAGRRPVPPADLPAPLETITLTDLTLQHVKDLAVRLRAPAPAALAETVFGLTAGHPGAVQDLLAESARHETYPYDPLGMAVGGNRPAQKTIADALRDRLLPGVGDEEFEVLVACSPAVDISQAELMAREIQSGTLTASPHDRLDELGWLHAQRNSVLIHPLPRHLLLHYLRQRPAQHEWAWFAACRWLREHPPAWVEGLQSDVARAAANRAYYDLAANDLDAAMGELDGILRDRPHDWLATFDWVVTAPHRYDGREEPEATASRLVRTVAGGLPFGAFPVGDLRVALATLVVSRWLSNDRQLDPWHSLDDVIARGYDAVAPYLGAEFYQRAKRYRDQAGLWSRVDRSDHPRPKGRQERS